ncbi:MAG: multiheme c-type cytochrome [Pseudomonadota bacterium]
MATTGRNIFQGRMILLSSGVILSCSILSGCLPTPPPETGVVPGSVSFATAQNFKQAPTSISLSKPQNTKPAIRLGEPLTNFTETNFIGSNRCSLCHGNLVDRDGRDMSINNHWRSTMMANAAKDPLWQAKVTSETARNPAIRKIIEEKCVACHMPMAWTQLNADKAIYGPEVGENPYEGFLNSTTRLHNAAMDGVSCSLCHQIQDHELGSKTSFSGKYTIDTATPPPHRAIFGPYQETVAEPMQTSIGFTPLYGSHTNDSALCATCHTLYTPFLDSAGNIAGEFPEQTPYLEWQHSEFGEPDGIRHNIDETVGTVRLCQECHMPHSTAGGVMIAKPAPRQSTEKDHFSQHHFVGGNLLLLNIMQDNLEPLQISASTAKIEATKERTVSLLQKETASLYLLEGNVSGNTLTVTVGVENRVGHKFPTGFPSRRAWIHFSVVDAGGATVFESGLPQTNGAIAGDDGDEKMSYEPHYDLINSPDQVQIYESVMHNTDNEVTFTLLRAAGYIKDNRLLPRGFDKKTADKDIAVQGKAGVDPDFIGGSDQVTYSVALSDRKGPYTVTAELLYSTVSHAFMQDLGKDTAAMEVGRFVGYYNQADKTPVGIAAVRGMID